MGIKRAHDRLDTHEQHEIREPSALYARNKSVPTFFGQPLLKGAFISPDSESMSSAAPRLYYKHPHGTLWCGDAITWLQSLSSASVDLVFADPPYNIKKAEWDTLESQQQYVNWSVQWIEEAARVLKRTGALYICGFSEILADLRLPASRFFKGCRWLIWHYKNKANLGADWGRSHESIVHFRKSKQFTFEAVHI